APGGTSHSMRIWRSPSWPRSVTPRRLRPISRWISWVRPLCRPRVASRSVRVVVERGSMPYSAVTQPLPVLRRNGGTRSSTEAVHSTCVSPNLARQEPSAYFATPGSRVTERITSASRPEGRTISSDLLLGANWRVLSVSTILGCWSLKDASGAPEPTGADADLRG